MKKFDKKVDDFLLDNTTLMDKLYIFKIYLKLKNVLSLGTITKEIEPLCNQLEYLINELKNDRANVLTIYELIEKAEKKSLFEYSSYLKRKLNLHVNELGNGLVINELYLDYKKTEFSNSEQIENDYEISFDKVLITRRNFTVKELVLKNEFVGGKKNGSKSK